MRARTGSGPPQRRRRRRRRRRRGDRSGQVHRLGGDRHWRCAGFGRRDGGRPNDRLGKQCSSGNGSSRRRRVRRRGVYGHAHMRGVLGAGVEGFVTASFRAQIHGAGGASKGGRFLLAEFTEHRRASGWTRRSSRGWRRSSRGRVKLTRRLARGCCGDDSSVGFSSQFSGSGSSSVSHNLCCDGFRSSIRFCFRSGFSLCCNCCRRCSLCLQLGCFLCVCFGFGLGLFCVGLLSRCLQLFGCQVRRCSGRGDRCAIRWRSRRGGGGSGGGRKRRKIRSSHGCGTCSSSSHGRLLRSLRRRGACKRRG